MAIARALRIQYEKAVCHVMARGNQGRPIFSDELDRKVRLETLARSQEETGWWIHAYASEPPWGDVGSASGWKWGKSPVSKAVGRVAQGRDGELNRTRKRLLSGLKASGK